MGRRVDVVISGAGPAGLAAGIVFARQGVQTLVCDQRKLPIDKPCGEGVMPTGVADLKRLGVMQYVDPEQASPFTGICYVSPQGHTATANFAEGPGWGIRRTALSAALHRRAQDCPALAVLDGVQVKPVGYAADGLCVEIDKREFSCRLLVGADGLSSPVRRWAGLDGQPQTLRRYGVRQHFPLPPWNQYVEVHWTHGVEAYVTPCGPTQVGVSFLWDRARYHRIHGGSALIPSLMHAFPSLQRRLAGVKPCSAPRAIGPLYRTARAPVGDGVLLIGDAAGYLDAITGEGISLALAQALCLETRVVPLLQDRARPRSRLSAHDLRGYANAYRAIVQPYYRMTSLVLFLSRHPQLATLGIRILGRQPAVFQRLLSANMGLVPPWALGWKNVWRLFRASLECGFRSAEVCGATKLPRERFTTSDSVPPYAE
ncbi:MAG: NAD(P)/FAD-dependent oxidoreductase [Candidatus Binatia bacterium]